MTVNLRKQVNMMTRKLLRPKVDVVFKLLFGDQRNVEILTEFLKSILSISDEEYKSITFGDPHLKREKLDDKLGIVDVLVHTTNGTVVHVEMQVLQQSDMPERIAYYNAKILTSQLKIGEKYGTLKKTISIVIADFDLIDNSNKYYHVFHQSEIPTGIIFTDIIEIHTLELGKIPENHDGTQMYEWTQFLKAEQEEEFEMLAKKNPEIGKAVIELKRLSQEEENQYACIRREMEIFDHNTRMNDAKRQGITEGISQGISQGISKNRIETAQAMRAEGFDDVVIAKITKLSIDEIHELQETSQKDN